MKQLLEISANSERMYIEKALDHLGSYDIDSLVEACNYRLNEIMAESLNKLGFSARTEFHGVKANLILVRLPDADEIPGEWATLSECRRLVDTARNLPAEEAFKRWREKIEPVEQEEYTREDALKDMRREREEAQADYQAGKINAEDLKLRNEAVRDFLSLIGSKTSDRKAESSRRNGMLGGRPKKSE